MVNNLEFANRLKTVMEYYGLTATALADSITIQRSSISHLLSGRNKPSLDFVLKILQKYPEVELYWLMNGNGSFPKKEETSTTSTPIANEQIDLINTDSILSVSKNEQEIDKIIVFYKNGTFKNYKP